MKYFHYILVVSGIMVGCQHKTKQLPNQNVPPKYVVTQVPVFKNQGTLTFANLAGIPITTIDIELADSPQKREMGLMYRTSLLENQGMLFIFDAEERQSFWMKNTHIPLDIIFVNEEKTIVHIAENCEPYSLKPIPSFEYAKYVVEVTAGFSQKNSIKVGSRINFSLLNS